MHQRALLFFFLFPFFVFAQPAAQWRKAIKNGVQSINSANAISVDKAGNVFVSGTSHDVDSSKKILLVKYDPLGNEQWRRIFQSEDLTDAVSVALAADANGDVIITGTVKNKSKNTDIVTLKYSTEGILLWQNFYAGKANLFDAPSAIAIDKKNNVLVCGYETASEANPDLLLVRYSSGGEKTFVKNFSTSQMDVAVDVAVDDSCNVYVCGNTNVSTRSADIIVMKFDSIGTPKWNYVYDGAEHAVDISTDMVLDDSAQVFVTGSANHSGDKSDVPLIKLSRNGKFLCEQLIGEGVSDGTANHLISTRKTLLVQTTFTNYMEQATSNYIYLADKSCYTKFKFKSGNEDVTYLEAKDWGNYTLLFGSKLTRPENTIAPYIEIRDSLRRNKFEYSDPVLISLLRIKDVLLTGRDVYFLGDDATENAGTISVVKYSFPEEPKKKPKVPTPNPTAK